MKRQSPLQKALPRIETECHGRQEGERRDRRRVSESDDGR